MSRRLSFHREEHSGLGPWEDGRVSTNTAEGGGKGMEGPRCRDPVLLQDKALSAAKASKRAVYLPSTDPGSWNLFLAPVKAHHLPLGALRYMWVWEFLERRKEPQEPSQAISS